MSMEVWITQNHSGLQHMWGIEATKNLKGIWTGPYGPLSASLHGLVSTAEWYALAPGERKRLILPDAIDPAKVIEVGDTVSTGTGAEAQVVDREVSYVLRSKEAGFMGCRPSRQLTLLAKAGEPEPEPEIAPCRYCGKRGFCHRIYPDSHRTYCTTCGQSGPKRHTQCEAIKEWNLQNGA